MLRARVVDVATETPAHAWQVVHGSTDTLGRPNAVSGTVLRPRAAWPGPGPRPVLSYGVGVHGLGRDARAEPPPRAGHRGRAARSIERALARGWAVAVSDGEGLGMPGPHTYGAGRAGGHALLDVARAAVRLVPELDAGRHRCCSGATPRVAATPPGRPSSSRRTRAELCLVAVAAGGVPADLYQVAWSLDGGPFSGLNLAVLVGLAQRLRRPGALVDPQCDAGDGPPARRRPRTWSAWCSASPSRWRPGPGDPSRGTTRPGAGCWPASVTGAQAPAVPTYLYQVTQDEIVPSQLGRDLARHYRLRGGDVTSVEVAAADHLSGAHQAADAAVAWLGEAGSSEHLAARAGGVRHPPPGGSVDEPVAADLRPGPRGAGSDSRSAS